MKQTLTIYLVDDARNIARVVNLFTRIRGQIISMSYQTILNKKFSKLTLEVMMDVQHFRITKNRIEQLPEVLLTEQGEEAFSSQWRVVKYICMDKYSNSFSYVSRLQLIYNTYVTRVSSSIVEFEKKGDLIEQLSLLKELRNHFYVSFDIQSEHLYNKKQKQLITKQNN